MTTATIDRGGMGRFLRWRRAALQPEDVGLPRGSRRRTRGLRREEVAALCHMSADYYSRLERGHGPQPSAQMVAAMARGLRLSTDERDHLFGLAGHHPPARAEPGAQVGPGLLRILDRLADTPAEVVSELGETLHQTSPGVALTGDTTGFSGPDRSIGYRWFTDPATRSLYAPEDHPFLSRLFTAGLREVVTRRGPGSRAADLAELLRPRSPEFRRLWETHEVGVRAAAVKCFLHPVVGRLELSCQTLVDPDHGHSLLVYTAEPGTESHRRLQRLVPAAAGVPPR